MSDRRRDEYFESDQLDEVVATCPWCFEPMQIDLDPSGGARQRYVEDCWVCCHPCVIVVEYDSEGAASVAVERE